MEEITSGPKKERQSNRSRKAKQPSGKTKTTQRVRAREAVIRPMHKTKAAIDGKTLRAAQKESLPTFISPSLATLSDKAPDGANWVHEIKFDGYRIQARLDRGK
jgi:bifunctional non-homologous end joining protein LigD